MSFEPTPILMMLGGFPLLQAFYRGLGVCGTPRNTHPGRKHINVAEILNQKDEVLARSRGLFIAVDAEKMFAKFVKQ